MIGHAFPCVDRPVQDQVMDSDLPTPWPDDGDVTLYHGDCRDILPLIGPVDAVVTDPPYGDTSLTWDSWVDGWADMLPTRQAWVFGSMRMWLVVAHAEFATWKLAQDIVWQKHNGSSFHADRFRRVHEHALHWYRGEWGDLYREVVTTPDARPRAVRRKERPPHTGHIEASTYVSEDGGPRLQRSVMRVRSCHGHAVHPTQKPLGILTPLIEYSVPPGGVVLDPFAGSGSTLVAARMTGRRAIGIEANEDYLHAAAERLRQGSLCAVDDIRTRTPERGEDK
jgi:site-specific DNA-methyltransferase (adenine-specific)